MTEVIRGGYDSLVQGSKRQESEAKARANRDLGELLDQLDLVHGPLDTAEDEREISRFVRLLTGQS
jgi:hypothetical protein